MTEVARLSQTLILYRQLVQSANGAFYFDGEAETMVRAVLGAMRETDAIITGDIAGTLASWNDGLVNTREVWQDMIDALLAED